MFDRPMRLDGMDGLSMNGCLIKFACNRTIARRVAKGIFWQMTNPVESAAALLDQMISQQEAKVLTLGRKWVPFATAEDLRNAEDFAILKDKPIFHFEDGILAGLIAANTALKAEIRSSGNP
jgi:hypothetical protein